MRRSLPLLALILAAHGSLSAQAVRGVLRDESGATPVTGALVSLVDAGGTVRAEVLTDAAGRYLLRAPAPGRYSLRAERIGHRSTSSAPLELAAGATVEHPLRAPMQRVLMDAVVATAGRRRCTVRPGDGVETALLWEEARKALRSTGQTRRQYPHRYQIRRTTRLVERQTRTVRSEESRLLAGYSTSPFVSVAPETLAANGYIEAQGDALLFHGPDAAVLLSDPFLDTHCFRVQQAGREHEGMVGLAFEPVADRKRPEVQGVLWLDRQTAELRLLEYRYTNLPPRVAQGIAEGRVEFRRLPDGAWIIPRWRIRMPAPSPVEAAVAARPVPGAPRAGPTQLVTEDVGEVMEIRTAQGTPLPMNSFAALSGVVYDSTRARPLAGAKVTLAGTAHSAVTDAEGRFRIDQLSEGAYSLSFAHPRLDSLSFASTPARVALVPPQELRQDLAVPGMGTILTASCVPGPDGPAVLAGTVTSTGGGAPLPGAAVVAKWQRPGDSGDSAQALAVSDYRGVYRFCSLPSGIALRLAARLDRATTGDEVRLQAGTPGHRDLALAAPPTAATVAAARPVRVMGTLVDSVTARPIAGAVVRFGPGLPERTTDRRGAFELPSVPPGTYAVEFRHRTYGEGSSRITVRGGAPTAFQLRVPRRGVLLDPLVVTAQRVEPTIYARSRRRMSNVVTRDEIEIRQAAVRSVGDLVRMIPGLQVRDIQYGTSDGSATREVCIEARITGRSAGGSLLTPDTIQRRTHRPVRTGVERLSEPTDCQGVDLVLDDMLLGRASEILRDLPVSQIESMEYFGPHDGGGMFGSVSPSGVLVIYTKGYGMRRAR